MKRILLTISCMLVVGMIYSQTILSTRLDYSLNLHSLSGNSLTNDNGYKFSPVNFGLNFNIHPVAYENKHFSFNLGVNYHNKRNGIDYDFLNPDQGYGNKKDYFSMNYLNFPLVFNYAIPLSDDEFALFIGAGGYTAYALNGNGKYTLNGNTTEVPVFSDDFQQLTGTQLKRWDSGLKFSLGIGSVYSKTGILLEYERSLTNLSNNKNLNNSFKNGTFFLTFCISGFVVEL